MLGQIPLDSTAIEVNNFAREHSENLSDSSIQVIKDETQYKLCRTDRIRNNSFLSKAEMKNEFKPNKRFKSNEENAGESVNNPNGDIRSRASRSPSSSPSRYFKSEFGRSVAREPYSSPEKRTFSSSGRGRSPSRSSICSDHSSPIYKASSSENYDSSLSSEKRKSSRGRYIISGQENPRRSRSPEKSSSSRPTTSVHKSHKSQEQDRHIQSPKIKYPSGELDRTSSSRERWHREDNMLSREDPFPRRIPRSSQEPLPFQTNRIRQQRPYSHGKNRYIGKVTQDRRSKQDVKICNDCNFQTTSQDELIQHTRMKIRYGSCPKQDPVANPSRTEEALGLLKKRHLLVVDKEWLMESIGGWEIRSLMPHEDEEAEEQK